LVPFPKPYLGLMFLLGLIINMKLRHPQIEIRFKSSNQAAQSRHQSRRFDGFDFALLLPSKKSFANLPP